MVVTAFPKAYMVHIENCKILDKLHLYVRGKVSHSGD